MLAYVFLALAIAFRFLPHPMQFTPVAAALLYFGAKQPRKQLWIPVAVLAASDVILNRMYGYAFSVDYFVTWAFYGAVIAFGALLLSKATPVRVVGASLATSVSFFLISNFMVWAVWTMYAKNLTGLIECYTAAVPFFRNTVVSDLLFSTAFFGVSALIAAKNEREAKQTA